MALDKLKYGPTSNLFWSFNECRAASGLVEALLHKWPRQTARLPVLEPVAMATTTSRELIVNPKSLLTNGGCFCWLYMTIRVLLTSFDDS